MKDCSSCPHSRPGAFRNYEESPCASCRLDSDPHQIIREPGYDLEKNYAASNLIRRLLTVRTDILIYMLEHPDLSQMEMAKRLRIPLSTVNFNFHRIRRLLPEFF